MLRKFESFVRDFHGMSLTEVMVGGAILAGVALGSASLFKEQKTSQKKIEHDQQLAMYHLQLTKFFNQPENCNTTIKGVVAAGNSIPSNLILPAIKKCTAGCTDQNLTADKSYDAYTPGAYIGTDYLSVGSYISPSNTWRLTSLQIPVGRASSGPVTIKVTYTMNPDIYNKVVTRDLVFNARFFGTAFKECRNNAEGSVNSVQNDLCKTLNMAESNIASDGRIAYWDEPTQTCKFTGTKDCSSQPGFLLDGVDSNGVVRCRKIVKPTDAADLQNPALQPCMPPFKAIPHFNIISRKMEIQCVP